jgi:hypothetical protein
MSNIVKLKRSAVASKIPSTSDLQLGELALNTYDGNLFFKKTTGADSSIVSVATLNGTQTLTNKTLNSVVITGSITAGGSTGGHGQVLTANGSGGVSWSSTGSTLSSLSDVAISNPQTADVLEWNGSQWVNGQVGVTIQSAVFAAGASTDLGLVTDLYVTHSEDLGLISDSPPALYYDLSILQVQGVVALSNLDSSVRTDYISYSIIFGF